MEDVLDRVALRGIAPIVPVRRVQRTVDFYTQILGFELVDRNAEMTYAYVRRGETGLMLLDLKDSRAVQATASYLSAYVWVRDVTALWAELAPRLARLPENRVTPLFEKAGGRKEFHVRDPDGFLLFFGEALD
jgi:catechol 2,3-dioxygenase-like lactoylglutathione lyase family enzyme